MCEDTISIKYAVFAATLGLNNGKCSAHDDHSVACGEKSVRVKPYALPPWSISHNLVANLCPPQLHLRYICPLTQTDFPRLTLLEDTQSLHPYPIILTGPRLSVASDHRLVSSIPSLASRPPRAATPPS